LRGGNAVDGVFIPRITTINLFPNSNNNSKKPAQEKFFMEFGQNFDFTIKTEAQKTAIFGNFNF